MWSRLVLRGLYTFVLLFLTFATHALSAPSTSSSSTTTTHSPTTTSSAAVIGTTSSATSATSSTPPDVYLNVPNLSVGRIDLDVDNLQADINLNANIASLVNINAGVAVSIQNINLTIVNVEAELELIVRLGHLVDIVNRVFESLDLNPSLISSVLGNVTSAVSDALPLVVGAVDGLLGTITQSGTTLSFLVDNLGNIVQQVTGANGSPVDTIVGNYLTNMTYTGTSETLAGGLIQKTYSYTPLNALVNIVFNTAGQVVQATVEQKSGSSNSTSTT